MNKDSFEGMLTEKLLAIVKDLQGGKITQARESIIPLLKDYHKDYRIWQLAGLIASQADNQAQAEIYLLQSHQLAPQLIEPLLNLARVYALENKLNLSASCFLKILSLAPKHIPAFHGLVSLLIAAEKYEKAIEYIDKWLEIEDNPKAFQMKAQSAIALKNFSLAEKTYKQYLALNPTDENVLLQVADFYMYLKKYHLAIPKYKKCLKRDRFHITAKQSLAFAYYMRQAYTKAIQLYREILETQPDDFISLNNLSCVYRDKKDYQAAIACLEKIIDNKKATAEVYANLATIYFQAHRYKKSKDYYEKAIHLSEAPRAIIQVYASTLLQRCEYKLAWPWFTKGFSCINEVKLSLPVWKQLKKNDVALLIADGQIKDIIQLSRFIPVCLNKIKALYCYHPNEAVREWLRTFFDDIIVLDDLSTLPSAIEYYSSFMALPELLSIDGRNIIRKVPYIKPPEVGEKAKGIFIALPQEQLKQALFKQYIAQLVKKYQKVTVLAKRKIYNFVKGVDYFYSENLVQLTEIIATHQKVITNDNIIIHIAGALAKSSAVILDTTMDWRWPVESDYSTWYANTKIIQTKTTDETVKALKQAIKE